MIRFSDLLRIGNESFFLALNRVFVFQITRVSVTLPIIILASRDHGTCKWTETLVGLKKKRMYAI